MSCSFLLLLQSQLATDNLILILSVRPLIICCCLYCFCLLQAYFYLLCIFILTSFFIIAAESVQDYKNNHNETIFILEHMCAGGLYLDYLLRIVACPHLRRFFLDPINLTDSLAVFSSVTKTLAEGALTSDTRSTWFTAIDMLQLLRILRLLRPMSKVTGFRLIYFTLRCSFRELLLVFMLLMFLMIVFSSLLYYLGGKKDITSIPHGMWFSLITMTTVGYGDIVPKTVGSTIVLFHFLLLLGDCFPSICLLVRFLFST